MRLLLLSILILLLSLMLHAANCVLTWAPSPDSSVTNYLLYCGTNQLVATNLTATASAIVSVGTNTAATLADLRPGQWWFAVTAQNAQTESVPSNILPVLVAAPPTNLMTVQVQYAGTLTTNWSYLGFFRLILTPP
ncbi:MAG: fibronectin type III domain-containing protein [Limisphaerales bacterium]